MKRTHQLIQIDHLNLRLPGMTRSEGQMFAQYIKTGLVQRAREIKSGQGAGAVDTSKLSLKLQSYSGQSIASLADHAVSQFIHQLNISAAEGRKR